MSRAAERYVLGLVVVISVLASGATSSQIPTVDGAAQMRGLRGAVTATLSAQTVPLGNTFELRVTVPVPPASAVYFPDELPTTEAIESHGPVHWKAQAAAGGATLQLTYPLIAFGTGNVRVPGLEVLIGPVSQAMGGAALPGGSVVGVRQTATRQSAQAIQPASSLLASSIPPREVRVASVFELEGVLAGVGPMSATDVAGSNWQLPSLALMLVSSSVLIAVLVRTIRRRVLSRTVGKTSVLTTDSRLKDARRAALRELDALLVVGLYIQGRTREFYTATSEIVRRYVEQLDSRLGPDLTSTELMRDLRCQSNGTRVEELSAEMSCAEAVKFGRLRPEPGAAEAHWRAIRKWIEDAGEWGS